MRLKTIIAAAAAVTMMWSCGQKAPVPMFVGTYTDKGSSGIYSFMFDQETGKFDLEDSARIGNPSYLVLAPDDSFLYCVSEYTGDDATVNAFMINPRNGQMRIMNKVLAHGDDPCSITTHGRKAFTANYSSGSISVFDIERDGTLFDSGEVIEYSNPSNVDTVRQAASHLHTVMRSPDGHYMFVTDLGGDCIYKFELRPDFKKGTPERTDLPKGCGPRHIDFSADSKYMYVITELSDEIIVFDYEPVRGLLTQKQVVKASDAGARGGADIHVSPDGKFLYASVRLKNDGIAIFKIKPDGTLEKVGYQNTGKHPRNFAITPNGKYLLVACRDDNRIEVYERNAETGLLTSTARAMQVSQPACIQFANPLI